MFKNRILVVDDEMGVRESLNQILQDEYTVDMAVSGEEALQKIKKEKPDLILLDYVLPGIKGSDVLAEAHKVNRYTPIVMITRVDNIQVAVELMKLGAYDYVNKPFNIDRILSIVKKALMDRDRVIERSLQVTTFFDLVSEMAAGASIRTLLIHLLDVSLQLITADSGSIMFIVDGNDNMDVEIVKGLSEENIKSFTEKVEKNLVGKMVQEGKPILLNKESDEKDSQVILEDEYNIESSLLIPIRIEEKVIGILNLNRNKSTSNFTEADLQLAATLTRQVVMVAENVFLQKGREDVALEAITSLAEAVDAKDHYTHAHSEKVTKYALLISEEMKVPDKEKNNIKQAALLHDIGKIGIKNGLLYKTGKLTLGEWQEVKKHPGIGQEILKPLRILEETLPIVYHHHERYDGQGYPDNLKGEEIPLGARILALADTFDAMSSARPYRKECPLSKITEEIKKCSGTQFDPKVVEAFFSSLEHKKDLWQKSKA